MIRAATHKDSLSIAEIHVASWKHTYVGQMPDDLLRNLSVISRDKGWRDILSSHAHDVLVAEEEGMPIGFVHLGTSGDDDSSLTTSGEIYALYLYPEHMRRGIGGSLWRMAITTLQERGFKEVRVWVLATHTRAHRFYERQGCVIDGTTKTITLGGAPLETVRYRLKL